MYLLETMLADGTEYTKHESIGYWEEKENSLAIRALIAALDRMQKSSILTVYTSCRLIRNAIENGWLDKWRQQEWKNSKGKQVQHAEMWKEVAEKTERHLVFVEIGEHSYRSWMQTELEKITE